MFLSFLFEVPALRLNLPEPLLFLSLAIVGALLIFLAFIQLNKNLSPFPSPKSNANLITSGVFKYIRHPIYTGIFLLAIGLGLYFNSGFKIIVAILLLLLFYFKSNYEEKQLLLKFPKYKKYRQATGRFFPKFKGGK